MLQAYRGLRGSLITLLTRCRSQMAMAEVLRESPTVVCFQEVVPATLRIIRQQLGRGGYDDAEEGGVHCSLSLELHLGPPDLEAALLLALCSALDLSAAPSGGLQLHISLNGVHSRAGQGEDAAKGSCFGPFAVAASINICLSAPQRLLTPLHPTSPSSHLSPFLLTSQVARLSPTSRRCS